MNYTLLIFIVVSAFLILQLFSFQRKDRYISVVSCVPKIQPPKLLRIDELDDSNLTFAVCDWNKDLEKIKELVPSFSWLAFSNEVKFLHQEILLAFIRQDTVFLSEKIENIEILEKFTSRMQEYKEKNCKQHTEVISSKIAKINNITFDVLQVIINVTIFEAIISFLQDSNSKIIEGSRNIQKHNLTWILSGTVSAQVSEKHANTNKKFEWKVLDICRESTLLPK